MKNQDVIAWLLAGDVSIQYQVYRDLMDTERKDIQARIATEGWGRQILLNRNKNGHWGERFYQPKWTSTHYTLLDLRNLNLAPENETIKETIEGVLNTSKAEDGGIALGPSSVEHSDVCVNGMFLNYASYFHAEESLLYPVVDSLLHEKMPDGGFNCRTVRSGASHGSLHSTISVIEGLHEFLKSGSNYRQNEIKNAVRNAEEFILLHRLFLSDRTGEIIDPNFLKLSFPCRWKYDVLRALDHFQYSKHAWDPRMEPAINVLLAKRNKHGSWNTQAAHPGQVHVKMEQAGKPGRWNTLRALRVLKHFDIQGMQ